MSTASTRSVFLAFALSITLATSSSATTMRHLDTRALTLGSSDILVGQVEAVRPRWSADRRKIFTDVDVRISQSLKGAPAEKITLTQLGGEIDGVKYSVPGGPLFKPGSEALLFVWRDAKGQPQVNGLAQGKFDIERDPKTGVAFVVRPAIERETLVRRSAAAEQMEPTTAVRLPLEQFVRSVLGEN